MPSSRSLRRAGATLAAWQSPQWTAATAGAALTTVLVGVPTAVVPSPLFSRSVPVQWWNYPVLAATAVLAGLVLATFRKLPRGSGSGTPEDRSDPSAKTVGRIGSAGGVLSLLAVGCPVCNKLVLLLLGASGALTYWAPLQPLVAAVSLVLLAEAALRRLSTAGECAVPARR